MIIDARLAESPFPREHIRNVINLSVEDNTVGYLCYYLAILVDAHFGQAVELKRGD
jgi:hypothetical protein